MSAYLSDLAFSKSSFVGVGNESPSPYSPGSIIYHPLYMIVHYIYNTEARSLRCPRRRKLEILTYLLSLF